MAGCIRLKHRSLTLFLSKIIKIYLLTIWPFINLGDGKQDIAPLRRKLSPLGIKEQGPHPLDKEPLEQGSYHQNRVFLADKKDRDLFSDLVTDSIPLKTFDKSNLKGTNSKLLHKIIERLSATHETMPDCYSRLVEELAKNTAVCGLIQA